MSQTTTSHVKTYKRLSYPLSRFEDIEADSIPIKTNTAIVGEAQSDFDTSYKIAYSMLTNLNVVQKSFTELFKFIRNRYDMTVNEYLEDKNIKVSLEFAKVSEILGEPIDSENIY